MATPIVFTNALLLDCTGAPPQEKATVVVEGDTITDIRVGSVGALPSSAVVYDLRGKTLMPGLTDAHVHVCAVDVNFMEQYREYPPSLLVAKTIRILEEALQQGYTTLRDAGGADYGLKLAIEQGYIKGPRLLVSGRFLSQTGGHGDHRRRAELGPPIDCCVGMHGRICDGVEAVRKETREQLRLGADQIKVMASGGAMSPADAIQHTQYTVEELRAAVYEAQAAGTYVMAHAYSAQSIRNCLQAGVRSIEHGNLLDAEVAALLHQQDAFLVPTMVTYEMLAAHGRDYGVPAFMLDKIRVALERSLESLKLAYTHGVKIGSGSDLLGPMQAHRARELALKAQVMSPLETLISATRTNAELFGLAQHMGTIEIGKWADLIVVDGNPLEDITLFQRHAETIPLVMKAGIICKDTLNRA